MPKRIPIILLILMFIGITRASGQYNINQDKVWAFGYGAGINFTSGSPVPFISSMATNEGTASVADASGNLLFYTNGSNVYNRTGAVMPNGTTIAPFTTSSTTQSSVIVPVLDSPNKYYIFSLQDASYTWTSILSYCKVDMTLAGGLGDVEHNERGVIIDSFFSEKMTVVQGDLCNVWVIVHKKSTPQFYAYNVSSAGISAPVISTLGPIPHTYVNIYGVVMASPDRHKLVTCTSDIPTGLRLFDFDPVTGIVSNEKVLDSIHAFYGAEFSPDNTKLYAMHNNGGSVPAEIDQFDIVYPTSGAIIASEVTIATGSIGGISQLKLGPDDKIYLNRFSDVTSSFMDVINHPNLSGTACGYVPHALALSPGTYGFLGLGNVFVLPVGLGLPTTFNTFDTAVCMPPGDHINLYARDVASEYEWNDGSAAPSLSVSRYGTYWVEEATAGCNSTMDTFKVRPIYDTMYTHSDTIICTTSDFFTATLIAPAGSYYLWYDNTTDSVNTVSHTGNYLVIYTLGCTRIFDTIHADFENAPPINAPDSICENNSVTLSEFPGGGVWASNLPGIAMIDGASGLLTGIAPGVAIIKYTFPSGCKQSKPIKVTPPPCISAVDEQAMNSNSISLFPNPANDICTVSYSGVLYPGAYISINDITGKLIHNYPLTGTNTVISLADLPAGVYQCRISVNGGAEIYKKLAVIR